MTIATIVSVSLLCLCAAAQSPAPLACNLKAIGAAQRPRYNELTNRLRNAVRGRSELPEGYAFKLDGKAISLPEAAEWIGLERLCCPFLTFQLSTAGSQSDWSLTLTGPEGVKAILKAEFKEGQAAAQSR